MKLTWNSSRIALACLAGAQFAAGQPPGPLYKDPQVEKRNPKDLGLELTLDGASLNGPGDTCKELGISNSPCIYLGKIPAATSVDQANSYFQARAAAAVYAALHANIANLSGTTNGEDYGTAVLARWAYPHYFNVPDVNAYQHNTADSLIRQVTKKTGTDGDYDVVLNIYIPLLYKYYDELQSWSYSNGETVADHIINTLMSMRGRLDPHESIAKTVAGVDVPETENHLFLIETARYLTNQIFYQRTHDVQYDNRRNGADGVQATAVYLLYALQGILQHEFIEYNARPYQDFIMMALLNLHSYAYDQDVRLAARMVLDYISAKVAVSSNDLRRAPPFRRRNEDLHSGPGISLAASRGQSQPDSLRSPLLLPGTYPDLPNQAFEPDPQGSWYAMLAGNTQLLNGQAPSEGPGAFGLAMTFAGLHDYRVPDTILDLFVTPGSRHFFQVINHAGNEIYAGSPSYLITAGGVTTDPAYPILGFGSGVDIGAAMPTTFMPTGQGLTLESMIQFGEFNISKEVHMCVAPDFACGGTVFIPADMRNDPKRMAAPLGTCKDVLPALRRCAWSFIDRGHSGEAKPGYYLAIYDGTAYEGDGIALLEAYDTWLHPGLTFGDFVARVLAAYGSERFRPASNNTYVTQSGQQISFNITQPQDERHGPVRAFARLIAPALAGTDVIDNHGGSGLVTIRNPGQPGSQITLDMRDVYRPVRTSEYGETERAAFDAHTEVWVDFNAPTPGPDGDFYHPFKTLADAQNKVVAGGLIRIVPSSTSERITLNKPMTLKSFRAGSVIGKQ